MRELVITPQFKKAYKKFIDRDFKLEKKIKNTLKQMRDDLFSPSLKTHSLQGKLSGLKACSCGYNSRILFSIEIDKNNGQEVIILLDIGTHDQVY